MLLRSLVIALCLSFSLPVRAADTPLKFDDPAMEQRYHALLSELRCLVCQNQSLEDSHAELAQDLRAEVHGMMSRGSSDTEILAFMVQRYGDFVLYRPPVRTGTWLLWLGPFLVLLIGTGVAFRFSRSRNRGAAKPLSEEEQAKLRQLLQATGDRDRE
ncbi:MAG: cytochrome c-type biogenesis protein CcmH [Gammaproteobacteria bacterium]|nr:cytochrome c-type biogenesis protein CcmH [Gammaproteobacteria bacterium]